MTLTQKENEFKFYMSTPSCRNINCLKVGILIPVTCKCQVTHYCSVECRDNDKKSHEGFCDSFCSFSNNSDLVVIKSNYTCLLIDEQHIGVQFEGYFRGKVAWGKVVFPPIKKSNNTAEGHNKEYIGEFNIVKSGKGKPSFVINGIGKSLKYVDPREKVKSSLHIGKFEKYYEHGPGIVHKNDYVIRAFFQRGYAELLHDEASNSVHMNVDKNIKSGKNRPISDDCSVDSMITRCKSLKKMIVYRVGENDDCVNGVFEIKPKQLLKTFDKVHIVNIKYGTDGTDFDLEYIVSCVDGFVNVIPSIVTYNKERFLSVIMITTHEILREIFLEYSKIDGVSSDGILGDISEISDKITPITNHQAEPTPKPKSPEDKELRKVRKEKRRHKSSVQPKICVPKRTFRSKEVSTRDMSITVDKEMSVKDMLSENKWVLSRQKNHLIYKRTVLLKGNDVPHTQTFTMPCTPSDRRGSLSSLKVLKNCNRGVSRIYRK